MINFILLIPRLIYFGSQILRGLFDPKIPLKIKLVIILGLFYVIAPNDILKDFIPIIGQIDDIIVIALTMLIYKYQTLKNSFINDKDSKNQEDKIVDGEFRNIDDKEEEKKRNHPSLLPSRPGCDIHHKLPHEIKSSKSRLRRLTSRRSARRTRDRVLGDRGKRTAGVRLASVRGVVCNCG